MYQPNQPTIPAFGKDWIGVNIKAVDSNGFAYQVLDKDDFLELRTEIAFEVLLAIYGTNAFKNSSLIRQGMELSQSIEILRPYNISFGGYKKLIRAPELHNQRWLERYNFDFTLNYIGGNKTSITSIISVPDFGAEINYKDDEKPTIISISNSLNAGLIIAN
jgi:hypothetical protein